MNDVEERGRRYEQLPQEVSEWLGSEEIMAKIYALQENFRLIPEQRKVISRLILDVFLGFVPGTKIVGTIAEKLSIPEAWAEPLAQQLNSEIIEPHKDWILSHTPPPTTRPARAVPTISQQRTAAPAAPRISTAQPHDTMATSSRPPTPPAFTTPAAPSQPRPPLAARPTEPSFYGRPPQKPSYNAMLDVPRYGAPMPTSNERTAVPPAPQTYTPHNLPTQSAPSPMSAAPMHPPRRPFELPPNQPLGSASRPASAPQWGSTPAAPLPPEPPQWVHSQTPPATPGGASQGRRVFDRGTAAAFDHDQWQS